MTVTDAEIESEYRRRNEKIKVDLVLFNADAYKAGIAPLSDVLELEGLIIGVSGKLQLWRGLALIAPRDGRLEQFDFERLAQRAADQRRRLEELHAHGPSRTDSPAGKPTAPRRASRRFPPGWRGTGAEGGDSDEPDGQVDRPVQEGRGRSRG